MNSIHSLFNTNSVILSSPYVLQNLLEFLLVRPSHNIHQSPDVYNLTLSNKKMGEKIENTFIALNEFLYTSSKNFNERILKKIHRIYVNQNILPNGFKKFTNLKVIRFDDDFNQLLMKNIFPSTLTKVTFGMEFNQVLPEGVLPNSLIKLTFGYCFNKSLKEVILPNSITQLIFGYSFNQPLVNLPNALIELTFGQKFNQQIAEHILPDSLLRLTFGYSFNSIITEEVLPKSLLYLKFGESFNKPLVKGVLPDGLIDLTFGYDFNKLLTEEILPKNISRITFSQKYAFLIKKKSLYEVEYTGSGVIYHCKKIN